MVPHIKVKTH